MSTTTVRTPAFVLGPNIVIKLPRTYEKIPYKEELYGSSERSFGTNKETNRHTANMLLYYNDTNLIILPSLFILEYTLDHSRPKYSTLNTTLSNISRG